MTDDGLRRLCDIIAKAAKAGGELGYIIIEGTRQYTDDSVGSVVTLEIIEAD